MSLRPYQIAGLRAVRSALDGGERSVLYVLPTGGGKGEAVILDHAGNYQIHGHVLQDREWSLEAKARRDRGEEPPEVRTCPMCYGVWPGRPRTCPACGYDFGAEVEGFDKRTSDEVRVIEGQLARVGVPGEEATAESTRCTQRQEPRKKRGRPRKKGRAA